jgi:hypothetical protein
MPDFMSDTMTLRTALTFKHLHSEPQPPLFRWLILLAWLDWAYSIFQTVTEVPLNQWGLGIPTLTGQALLILGLMLGSNVARSSYIVWTMFWTIVVASGESATASSVLDFARIYGKYAVGVLLTVGLLLPRTNRWYAAVRAAHRQASAEIQTERLRRNLRVAACWAAVWPISFAVAYISGIPAFAVVVGCAPGGLVAVSIAGRQGLKLLKQRRALSGKAVA